MVSGRARGGGEGLRDGSGGHELCRCLVIETLCRCGGEFVGNVDRRACVIVQQSCIVSGKRCGVCLVQFWIVVLQSWVVVVVVVGGGGMI